MQGAEILAPQPTDLTLVDLIGDQETHRGGGHRHLV
jgi:hypothetical protein